MGKLSDVDMARHKITKTARTIIRLKHSLAADVELNDVLPETIAEFDAAVARGELRDITVGLEDVIGKASE
jgi:hypothetical protein